MRRRASSGTRRSTRGRTRTPRRSRRPRSRWELLRLLREELRGLGLEDAELDEHGYVFATVPATVERQGADDRLPRARRHVPRGDRRRA